MATLPRRPPTLRDVAGKAGVSLSTASRAARGHPAVDAGTRERVNAAIELLGYRPDTAARSIRTGRSLAVGFVVSDIANPLFSVIARGADEVLREHGYSVVLVNSGNDPQREHDAIQLLESRRIDGLMISVADETSADAAVALRDVPCVLLDREMALPSADAVCSDHATGMRLALEHLRDLGHRRIALIGGSLRQFGSRARIEAFHALRSELGLDPDDELLRVGEHSAEAGRLAALAMLDLPQPPTALIAGNNQILRGALEALYARDVDIPADLSLIAADDVDICKLHRPQLDVIARDIEQLGRVGAQTLLERLKSPKAPGRRVPLPVWFEHRASSARPKRRGTPT